ncbi:hypothetical protein [Mariniluteicoccus flavus]
MRALRDQTGRTFCPLEERSPSERQRDEEPHRPSFQAVIDMAAPRTDDGLHAGCHTRTRPSGE